MHGAKKALALTSDCTPRYVAAGAFEGGKQAVAEAWRNLTAVGADPVAITDNLNFGNPERPEIMGQIARAIDGMAEACRALDFPVVSGNVSLYNETGGVAIPPTPTVGAVGLIPDYALRADFASMKPGDALLVVGASHGELGSSLYLRELLGREDGAPPPVDLEFERRNGDFVRELIRSRLVSAVHDLSDGGLAIALAESCLRGETGCTVRLPGDPFTSLFSESAGRAIVAVRPGADAAFDQLRAAHEVPGTAIGAVGGDSLVVEDLFSIGLDELAAVHTGTLPALFG